MKRRKSSTFPLILRLLIGAVFAASGVVKLANPADFYIDIQSFHLAPVWLAFAVALVLPWLEVYGALALWTGIFYRGGIAALMLLTAGFLAWLGLAWQQGINVACGCFGDWLVFPNYPSHLAFNGLLFLALVYLAGRGRS